MHPARGGRPFDEVGTRFRALEGQVGVVLPIGKPRAADAETRQSSRPRAGFILCALALDDIELGVSLMDPLVNVDHVSPIVTIIFYYH